MVGSGLTPGQVVESIAGRDRGKHYIVLRLLDERFCLVVNGRERPVAKPKQKNRRHLLPLDLTAAALADRLARGETVTDEEIDQALRAHGF